MNGSERVVRHGSRSFRIRKGHCHTNAIWNKKVIVEEHLDKVLDGDADNVTIVVGSMGFGPKRKVHWEFGNPKWKKADDFINLFGRYDAHVWVEYIDTDGKVITIDPWFRSYKSVCEVWRVPLDGADRAERHYHEIADDTVQAEVFSGMVEMSAAMGRGEIR